MPMAIAGAALAVVVLTVIVALPGRAADWPSRPVTMVVPFAAGGPSDVAGRIVAPSLLAEMLRPRSDWPEESRRYGLGFHLQATGDGAWLEGYDAGVSFTSLHQPSTDVTFTVISNWTDGAWPMVRLLRDRLAC